MTSGRVVGSRGVAPWVAAALPLVAIALVGLGYLALNLGSLGAQSYWSDELISVGFANQGLEQMLRLVGGDIHPPLYSSAIWVWIRITGTSTEAAVRLISLVAVATGIVVLGGATWRRIGHGAAVLVVTLGVTSTLAASFAREARPHALAFGLICIATAAWLFALRRGPIRLPHVVVFGVFGGLAALTQYYALLIYAVEAALLLAWLALGGRWREAGQTVVVAGLSVAPVALWLAVTLRLLQPSSTPPLTEAWAEWVAGWAAEPFTAVIVGSSREDRGAVLLVVIVLVVGAIGLAIAALLARRDARLSGSPVDAGPVGRGAAALAAGTIALGIAVIESLVLWPTLHYRSILSILPVLYVGIGAGITLPFRRFALAAGVAIAAVLVVVAVRTPEPRAEIKDQWREAAAILVGDVRESLPADRVALVRSPWGTNVDWVLVLNNAVGRRAPAADLPQELRDLRWVSAAADVDGLPVDRPLLLVAFHYWAWDRHAAIVAAAQARFGPCEDRSVSGITVLRCDPASAP